MKTIEQFRSEIIANKELAEKLTKITNEQELEAFLKENDVSGTAEAFKVFVKEKERACRELSDDALEEVSGGGWGSMKHGYESGGTPRFKVGDHVIMMKYRGFWEDRYGATITGIDPEKSFGEFTYSIRYDDGDTEKKIYESQMLEQDDDGNWNLYTSLE